MDIADDLDFSEQDGLYGDEPPQSVESMGKDTLASLQYKKYNIVNVKTLSNPVPKPSEAIGKDESFSVTPSIVHFGGLVVGKVHEEVINIVNTSKTMQRLYVFPPREDVFKAEYEKSGSMAPGMSQKIVIKFKPKEYRYYHDYLRIQTHVDKHYILVPLHAYPTLNKLDFPRSIQFGASPLCERKTKQITLKCSIPVDFSFDLEVLKPHPYFKVSPTSGVIPANGDIQISVTFIPITLGRCSLSLRLHVGQYGFDPMDCEIDGQAVSGLLESRALKQAEERLMNYIKDVGNNINTNLGNKSTFRGDLQFRNDHSLTMRPGQMDQIASPAKGTTKFLKDSVAKNHSYDPVAAMLSTTFKSSDINTAFDAVLQDTKLLGTKVLVDGSDGVRALHGVPKMNIPSKPRGPGAGNAFDAGGQWTFIENQKVHSKKAANGTLGDTKSFVPQREAKTVDGLKIPPYLDDFPAVNFVLTQEPGKLKPKDLKIAIEKSRAEREARAEEQAKIREEGGEAGQLDVRAILADERMNSGDSDPFKRQLRELAFLADVDDLDKLEAEKEFRVSEEYLGSLPLSQEDIGLIKWQRAQSHNHKERTDWRVAQVRQHTLLCTNQDKLYKAGATVEVAEKASKTLEPSYDSNKNDIWAKRMNTLRRFVSLVSRWLVRRRLDQRMGAITKLFNDRGLTTREQVREFIALENEEAKSKGPSATNKGNKGKGDQSREGSGNGENIFPSVASMVCDAPNEILHKREAIEAIISTSKYEFKSDMVRRVLFPKFTPLESTSRTPMTGASINDAPSFSDHTFFQLKVRPDYESMGYNTHSAPSVPLSFPPTKGKFVKKGAYLENFTRPPADLGLKYDEMKKFTADAEIIPLPETVNEKVDWIDTEGNPDLDDIQIMSEIPDFISEKPMCDQGDIDFFKTESEYLQIFPMSPKRCSMDDDWLLRPFGTQLVMKADKSLRQAWISEGGFASCNTYLLGGYESTNRSNPPIAGPTISDYYLQDRDRHRSGLHCYGSDHKRALDDDDGDIAPLQDRALKEDHLTDSESDDEEAYNEEKASLPRARKILFDTDETKDTDAISIGGDSVDGMDFGASSSTETRVQVELLRDRKIIEMETNLRKEKYDRIDLITQK
jgi:hypothetical protein